LLSCANHQVYHQRAHVLAFSESIFKGVSTH
jgi:hypothetical protein